MAQCFHPVLVRQWIETSDGEKKKVNNFHYVPCGKCVACLNARRVAWTYRLVQEQNTSDRSYFLGLTYDDEHIPIKRFRNVFYTGFCKRHCQLFLKRFRQKLVRFNKDIRCSYFLVSEYGSSTFRPHYHCILFLRGVTGDMENYIYKFIEDSWSFSSNIPSIQPTCEANIHYCTKYSLKDVGNAFGNGAYFNNGDHQICWSKSAGTYLERPFMLCSTRPYLGSKNEHKMEDHITFNGIKEVSVYFNGYRQAMPRIFRKKIGSGSIPQEMSSDPRLSFDKYNKYLREYFSNCPEANMDDFQNFIDYKLDLAESRLLDLAKRKQEKL